MNIAVTGSSTGIGRALVERLLSKTHRVWGLARSSQDELQKRFPGSFRASRCDVARWEQVELAAAEIGKEWKNLDALVCCAGIQGEVGRCMETDPRRWSETVRVNLDGTYYAIRALFSLLSQGSRRAKIVCFSGGGATKARAHFTAYGAAKTAVVRLVETIAEEEKERALDINALAPGAINTRLTEEVIALGPEKAGQNEYQAALKQKAGGGASLDRALDCVEWLLSPASDGVSGRLISAPWDPWERLGKDVPELAKADAYTLRRITPEDTPAKP